MTSFGALALDLDGTLLRPDGKVSDRDLNAVRAAVAAGWHVVLATARWYRRAERIAIEIGLDGPVIACSGAQVRRLGDGVDLFDRRLPAHFTEVLYDLCDRADGAVYVYEDHDVLWRAPDAVVRNDVPEVHPVRALAGAIARPRCVLVVGESLTAQVLATFPPARRDGVRFLRSTSGHGASVLTLTGQGADKGAALAVACAEVGITVSSVVAVGDSETDVEMFRVAGASVAMGQASPDVQAAATWVTADNTDDGVGRAIERLLDGRHPGDA